jgi:hypothetical protein
LARIKTLTIGSPSASVHPTEVDCEIRRVTGSAGETYLQLSTFGSATRVSEPKVSQTIQIDRDTARQIRQLIDETFGS